jgi:chloramphenicol O-acetyltransferase type A
MKTEVNPKDTSRAEAFELWMSSPMPMVTLTKTFNVTPIRKLARRTNMKFNALLCWCIGRSASQIQEFYLLPENGKLFSFDDLAINVIVHNKQGGISSCDIPYDDNITTFCDTYNELTHKVSTTSQSSFLDNYMVVGTSAMIQTELDSIVNQYTDKFCNPMVMWGKYRKRWWKTILPISFQFHHVQMDGGHAATFLELLQKEILNLK